MFRLGAEDRQGPGRGLSLLPGQHGAHRVGGAQAGQGEAAHAGGQGGKTLQFEAI